MASFLAFISSPSFIVSFTTAFLTAFAWLIRLEAKTHSNTKDIKKTEEDLSKYKEKQSEHSDRIYGKMEQLRSDIGNISTSVSRIEGKLEHYKDK